MKLSFFGRRLERIVWGSPVRTGGTSCAVLTISQNHSMDAVVFWRQGGRRNQEKIIVAEKM